MKNLKLYILAALVILLTISVSLRFALLKDDTAQGEAGAELSNTENEKDDNGSGEEIVPENSQQPSLEPSLEPSPVIETEEPIVEEPDPEEPSVELHSGLREDGSFDEGTLFIGDSLTCLMITHYLDTYDYIGDAKYTCKAGAALSAYFSGLRMQYGNEHGCIFSREYLNMTFPEAAASLGEDARAIYIMLGTNQTPNASPDNYIEIVDYLLEVCPNATVHLQTIPYATAIPYEAVNENVWGAYEYYQEVGEPRVMLVDTCTAIGENIIGDGIHMNDAGRDNWYKALLAHAEENDLPQ